MLFYTICKSCKESNALWSGIKETNLVYAMLGINANYNLNSIWISDLALSFKVIK